MSERGISVTLKYPKPKYQDAPWIVFHGTPAEVREDLLAAFGMDAEESAEQTLHEVVLKAQQSVQAAGEVASQLGGRVLSQSGGAKSSAWSQVGSQPSGSSVGDEDAAPADPTGWLKTEIDQATTVAGLQRLWADNKPAFSEHPELMELYKAKGKALSA